MLSRSVVVSRLVIGIGCIAIGAGGGWLSYRQKTAVSVQIHQTHTEYQARTVSWFAANPQDMRQKIATCNDNPGAAIHDAECENALEANEHLAIEAMLAGNPEK